MRLAMQSGQAASFLTTNMLGFPPLNVDALQCRKWLKNKQTWSSPLVKLVYRTLNLPVLKSIKQPRVQDVFLWFPCVVSKQRADSEQWGHTGLSNSSRHWGSNWPEPNPWLINPPMCKQYAETLALPPDARVIKTLVTFTRGLWVTNSTQLYENFLNIQSWTRLPLTGTSGIAHIVKPHPSSPQSKNAQPPICAPTLAQMNTVTHASVLYEY